MAENKEAVRRDVISMAINHHNESGTLTGSVSDNYYSQPRLGTRVEVEFLWYRVSGESQ